MCGIWGLYSSRANLKVPTRAISKTLSHRGPDDSQTWHDSVGVWLGHSRLAVLDLTGAGRQPMLSSCGRYVLVFNGEIYNHRDVRAQLENDGCAPPWRGHSDTESLIEAISAWGINKAISSLVGMFAFALWDSKAKSLTLARDRLGEKPLYYGWTGSGFCFASELKALREIPGFKGDVDRNALALYMRYGYVPEPWSIYEGVAKLPPGSVLVCSTDHITTRTEPTVQPYWDAVETAKSAQSDRFIFSTERQAENSLESILRMAISGQMVSDVPLGAFLSGGIDSSLVVAIMQEISRSQGGNAVKTFSIGFKEKSYDEAPHARAVANHLGTTHTELYVSPAEAMAIIPKLPVLYDEPFADSSQVPTYLVCNMAREHVTVALSGDGGDELFGGYNRYQIAARMWRRLSHIPLPIRKLLGHIACGVPIRAWNSLYEYLLPVIPSELKIRLPGEKMHKAGALLVSKNEKALYRGLVSYWDPAGIVINVNEPACSHIDTVGDMPSLIEKMMLIDSVTYLPGDILTKVDRAAMAVGLETRIPFLDHRLYEFAWRLPLEYRVRNGIGKWLLRKLLYNYVPRSLIDRPKMGFGVPMDEWLRGPLRDWAEALLDETRIKTDGYFNPIAVREKWHEHLSGKRNWQHQLWAVLMFQAWVMDQQ